MPTIAEGQVAAVVAWLAASSRDTVSPMGNEIRRGPDATVLSLNIDNDDLPEFTAEVEAGSLPLFTPQATTGRVDMSVPVNQPLLLDRLFHLLWKIEGGVDLPAVVVVGIPTRQTSILAALDAVGLGGIDLSERGVLAVPLYCFSAQDRFKLSGHLPLN
jgi:hypothetical protein